MEKPISISPEDAQMMESLDHTFPGGVPMMGSPVHMCTDAVTSVQASSPHSRAQYSFPNINVKGKKPPFHTASLL